VAGLLRRIANELNDIPSSASFSQTMTLLPDPRSPNLLALLLPLLRD
jgi:hypothetical protein